MNLVSTWVKIKMVKIVYFYLGKDSVSYTNVVGMSIEKLFDMWRNDEILKYYVICAAVSALSWLSQFCTSKKNIGIGCVKIPKFVISSFRHIFSIDMPTTLKANQRMKVVENYIWFPVVHENSLVLKFEIPALDFSQ